MRERLVGTRTGFLLSELRGALNLVSVGRRNPEQASMVANAMIAERLIASLMPRGGSFLDVGAHIGSVFASVRRTDPSATICAVEADAGKARRLESRFPDVRIVNCAIGEAEGVMHFHADLDRPGFSALDGIGNVGANVVTTEVTVRPLDDVFPDERFDVVKIDIEGAELGALRGGADLFRRSRPTILFESAGIGTNGLGYSAEALWDWFDGEGFDVALPERLAHDAPALERATFADAHHYPIRSINFFAVPREARRMVRDKAREILGIKAAAGGSMTARPTGLPSEG
jgi:FkbM family methyltransferase